MESMVSFAAREISQVRMPLQVVTSWLTLALYAWVLVAPLVCTDRDFS
jgi:hypothetical protein